MIEQPESGGPQCSMLERIAPIRRTTEVLASNIHLGAVAGLCEEFRRLLLRQDAAPFPARLERARTAMSGLYSLPDATVERCAVRLRAQPVCDATRELVEQGVSTPLYLLAFVRAAELDYRTRVTREALEQALAGVHPDVSQLALPGTVQNGRNNHTFLLENTARNYLRLAGVEPPIPYDRLHERHLYRFTHAKEPHEFVQEVLAYRNGPRGAEKLIEGKAVLTLGPGRGRDEEALVVQGGAAAVDMIEGSASLLPKLEKTKRTLPPDLQGRFHAPAAPQDMLQAVKERAASGKRFDTLYCHSAVHYFDDEALLELLRDVRTCLKPNGHFAFAVKAPGAVLDGHGIPLIRDIETLSSSRGLAFTQERVRHRMWLNFDGQMRMFRDKAVWLELLQTHFSVPRVTEHSVERYETDSQGPQTFYYFICKQAREDAAARRVLRKK
jgi:SAM-dependent methyltransferase